MDSINSKVAALEVDEGKNLPLRSAKDHWTLAPWLYLVHCVITAEVTTLQTHFNPLSKYSTVSGTRALLHAERP